MSLSIIVAKAEKNVIGKQNTLLWHISDDMKRFKSLTMGHPILMGRKTFESLPKVLPGRTHYVLTGNKDYKVPEGVLLFYTLDDLLKSLPEGENFIIGGARFYRQTLPLADTIYLTDVHKEFPDGDAYFPEINMTEWKEISRTPGTGPIPHDFVVLKRK